MRAKASVNHSASCPIALYSLYKSSSIITFGRLPLAVVRGSRAGQWLAQEVKKDRLEISVGSS